MITLAFDSTAKVASVAVSDGERPLGVYNIDVGLTQSELLLPMAEDLLRSLKMSFSDVELLACSVGPGSFTGVRIGVALVKGLAFGRNIPCVGVSTLEALAENLAGLDGIIVPVMDARRAQTYTATFDSDGSAVTRLTEDRAISISQLADELKGVKDRKIYLVGDGYNTVRTALIEADVKVESTPPLLISQNAYSIATVAERMYREEKHTDDLGIAPTYLRMPQAERERLERLKAEENKD